VQTDLPGTTDELTSTDMGKLLEAIVRCEADATFAAT
jgi:hypothetical protein